MSHLWDCPCSLHTLGRIAGVHTAGSGAALCFQRAAAGADSPHAATCTCTHTYVTYTSRNTTTVSKLLSIMTQQL